MKIKSTVDMISSILDIEEEIINEHEKVVIKTIQMKHREKKKGQSISKLWDNFKWPKIHIIIWFLERK